MTKKKGLVHSKRVIFKIRLFVLLELISFPRELSLKLIFCWNNFRFSCWEAWIIQCVPHSQVTFAVPGLVPSEAQQCCSSLSVNSHFVRAVEWLTASIGKVFLFLTRTAHWTPEIASVHSSSDSVRVLQNRQWALVFSLKMTLCSAH